MDLRQRQVHDIIWIVFGGIGIVVFFLEEDFVQAIINIGIAMLIAPIAVFAWKLGLFGGADAFAILVLAFIAPQITLENNFVTPFTIISNAAVIAMFLPLSNFVKNSIFIIKGRNIFEGFDEPIQKKIMAMFLGSRQKYPKFSYSIEKYDGDLKKFTFKRHHAEDAEFCTQNNTWVTQGVPFLLYIFIGFVTQVVLGDIILSLFM